MRALTLFGVECRKARRRHDVPVTIGIALLVLLWAGANYEMDTAQELATGYSAMYYAIPVMNAVVMPVGMATLASCSSRCKAAAACSGARSRSGWLKTSPSARLKRPGCMQWAP